MFTKKSVIWTQVRLKFECSLGVCSNIIFIILYFIEDNLNRKIPSWQCLHRFYERVRTQSNLRWMILSCLIRYWCRVENIVSIEMWELIKWALDSCRIQNRCDELLYNANWTKHMHYSTLDIDRMCMRVRCTLFCVHLSLVHSRKVTCECEQ